MTEVMDATGGSTPAKKAGAGRAPVYVDLGERVRRGREARSRVPRSSHGNFEAWPGRPDPVDLLEQQAITRVPDLVPVRYGRMAVSPFTFYRGAALVMASDLASTPRTGITVQCCGDAHLSNFGGFGTPERSLVFDLNDFDETLPGPWEWDVKRLAASFAIAGRDRGFSVAERRQINLAVGRMYREAMTAFAASPHLDVWYQHLDVDSLLSQLGAQVNPLIRKRLERAAVKARLSDSLQATEKLTAVVGGSRRIISDPPVIVPFTELFQETEADALRESLERLIAAYRRTLQSDRKHLLEQYSLVDMARKVVGVGSVGTRAYVLFFVGRDHGDPLLLQAKEAQQSVLAPFVGRSQFTNQGQRVVAGQRLMQAASDIFLGWERVLGVDGIQRDYYVRQLRDWKASANIDQMIPEGMEAYARVCAWTLSRAHARSGDRVAIAAYLGRSDVFDRAIADFSETYADQNERDYATFQAAIKSGRIAATMGV